MADKTNTGYFYDAWVRKDMGSPKKAQWKEKIDYRMLLEITKAAPTVSDLFRSRDLFEGLS